MTILTDLIEAANEVYSDNKVLRDICIVQGVHESNLLVNPSQLAVKYNNLFGIKKKGTIGIVLLPTLEFIKGQMIKVKEPFGFNKNTLDSVKQHQQIMNLTRYKAVREAVTFEDAALALVKGGYATDPRYSGKLVAIHEELKKKGII